MSSLNDNITGLHQNVGIVVFFLFLAILVLLLASSPNLLSALSFSTLTPLTLTQRKVTKGTFESTRWRAPGQLRRLLAQRWKRNCGESAAIAGSNLGAPPPRAPACNG